MVKRYSYMKLKGVTSLVFLKQDKGKGIELMKLIFYLKPLVVKL